MNIPDTKDTSIFRFERKFRVDQLTRYEIESIVKLHPAGFSEMYPIRNVNNIYLDSMNLQTFVDNIDGVSNRTKFRIRWYGDLFGKIAKPVLELKIKRNMAGTKKKYLLKPFKIEPEFSIQNLRSAVIDSDLSEANMQKILQLRPMLLNRYTRKYFVSANGQYRLTLDYDLYYYRIQEMNNSFLHHNFDRRTTIIELKYPFELDKDANEISRHFPFRMTKNSKYVSGIQILYC